MESRSSREVRESFFRGENSRGTRGPARGRGHGGLGAGTGLLPSQGGEDQGLLGGDRPTKDPWGARSGGPPSSGIRPPQPLRVRHSWSPQLGPVVGGLGAPYSAHVCVPGAAGSGHVPRPQAARRGRRVSATSPPIVHSGLQLSPRPPSWNSWTPATRAGPPLGPRRASPPPLVSSPSQGSSPLAAAISAVGGVGDPGVLCLQSLPGVPTGSFSAPDPTPEP